jgi:hypothetical protein
VNVPHFEIVQDDVARNVYLVGLEEFLAPEARFPLGLHIEYVMKKYLYQPNTQRTLNLLRSEIVSVITRWFHYGCP